MPSKTPGKSKQKSVAAVAVKLRRTLLTPETLAGRLRLTPNQIATLKRLHERSGSTKNRKNFYSSKLRQQPTAPSGKPASLPKPSVARIAASFELIATPAAKNTIDALVKKGQSKLKIERGTPGKPAQLVVLASGGGKTVVGKLHVEKLPAKAGDARATTPYIKVEDVGGSKVKVTYFVPQSPAHVRNPATMHEGPPSRRMVQAQGNQAGAPAGSGSMQKSSKVQKSPKSAKSTSESVSSAATGNAGQQAQTGLGDFITQLVTAAAARDFLQLGASPIEDVAFYDFSDYVFVREPDYFVVPPPQPDVTQPEALVTDDLEQQGINANDLHLFTIRLRQSFERRISEWSTAQYGSAPNTALLGTYQASIDRATGILYANPETLSTFLGIYLALPDESSKQEFLTWIVDDFSKLAFGNTTAAKLSLWYFLNDPNQAFLGRYQSDARLLGQWLSMEASALDDWSDYSPYADAATQGNAWDELLTSVPSETERPEEYKFALYASGTYNLGVRLVYRQTWRPLGNQRGELVKTIPLGPKQSERISIRVARRQKVSRTQEDLKSTETTTETSDSSKDSSEVVREAANSFGWNVEASATANVGYISATLSAGARGSSDERSRNTSQKLTDSMQRSASRIRTETKVVVSTESETTIEETRASEIVNPNDEIAVTYVFSRLQRQYQVLTQLSEAQNVVLIAEPVPQPYEIVDEWVRRYDWILAKALLDDSFRPILSQIGQEYLPDAAASAKLTGDMESMMRSTVGHLGKMAEKTSNLSLSRTDVVSGSEGGYRDAARDALQRQREHEAAMLQRIRFRQHIADNILHYCRAIWNQEDPQQRLLRYRKQDIRVPTVWKFVGSIGDLTGTLDLTAVANALALGVTDAGGAVIGEATGEFQSDSSGTTMNLADLIAVEGPLGYVGNYAVHGLKPRPGVEELLPLFDILKSPYVEYETVGSETLATLIDPTYKFYKDKYTGKAPANQKQEEKEEIADIVPDLRRKLFDARLEGGAAETTFWADAAMFGLYYPEFLYRKQCARRLALDTNNLVLDLLPGEGSTLESFKRAHRIIDVLKADEERNQLSVENERRRRLLSSDELGNPEAQKTFIVVDSNLVP